jgi:glutaminyl-tRNA synthetase
VFRLAPGKEVRLKHSYYITCKEAIKDANGNITELHCTYDPLSKGGFTPDERKIKGTLHFVSASHAIPIEARLYDHLLTIPNTMDMEEGKTYKDYLNPNSLVTLTNCLAEPYLANQEPGTRFQFLRMGYFIVDKDSTPQHPVFNRIVPLRDTWAKLEKKM